jgi:hypothetical protein
MTSWNDLIFLILAVFGAYLVLSVFLHFFTNYLKRKRISIKNLVLLHRVRLLYKPIAWLIVIGGFVTLDPLPHGFLVLLVAAIGYRQFENYISGLVFRSNTIIPEGTLIQAGKIKGKINKIASLGIVIGTDQGERWVWYKTFLKTGFTLLSNQEAQQQSVYIKSKLPYPEIKTLVFSHPVLALGKEIQLKKLDTEDIYLMQYSLAKGASNEDLINFLHENEMATHNSEKFEN